jgi:anti-sigma factor RsiW
VAAAAIIAAVTGGFAGWMLHGASAAPPRAIDIVTAEALNAHRLYIGEARHPIEVRANEEHLVPWLSKRVGTTLRAPDLREYSLKLLGGRLLPGANGPAALFMYESPGGERITVYSSRCNSPRSALRYKSGGGEVAAVRWVENGIAFIVSGPADRDRLSRIAEAAYEQMDNPPARASVLPLISKRGS